MQVAVAVAAEAVLVAVLVRVARAVEVLVAVLRGPMVVAVLVRVLVGVAVHRAVRVGVLVIVLMAVGWTWSSPSRRVSPWPHPQVVHMGTPTWNGSLAGPASGRAKGAPGFQRGGVQQAFHEAQACSRFWRASGLRSSPSSKLWPRTASTKEGGASWPRTCR